MSVTETRMPRETAEKAVGKLMAILATVGAEYIQAVDAIEVVGSIRRGEDTCGDIDLIAPLPDDRRDGEKAMREFRPEQDRLFAALNACSRPAWTHTTPGDAPGLFQLPELPSSRYGFLVPARGLKPWFHCAEFVMRTKFSGDIKLQVSRYTPENRGWITAMRTGPSGFGVALLTRWKQHHGIPIGAEGRASVDGYLVSADGQVIPVPDERALFEKCGMPYLAPENRRAWAEAVCKAVSS